MKTMKPYFLAIYNTIKFAFQKLRTTDFKVHGVELFGWNTKLLMGKKSKISFGEKIVSDGRMVMIVDNSGMLTIGSHVYFNEDAMISCKGRIEIGSGCKFGPNVKIIDNNHKFDSVNGVSDQHKAGDIFIGENCWIGTNVVILKDTKIGKNCVIGAGCVVSGVIPEKSIVTQGSELVIRPMGG